MPEDYTIYCAYCGDECENDGEEYIFGDGSFPYCSESCAKTDEALE